MHLINLAADHMLNIAGQFDFAGEIISLEPFGCGHINDTYLVKTRQDGRTFKYLLQRITHKVCTSPFEVVSNIEKVTSHLRGKIAAAGGDPSRETLTFISTKQGLNFYISDSGDFFRAYKYISNTVTYQRAENPMLFYHSGKAFGKFQRMLADFDASQLYETLPNFHDTRKRYAALIMSAECDIKSRAAECTAELDFAVQRRDIMPVLLQLKDCGMIPERVTHNDTKLNNVMLDEETGEGVCVVDLDTVMPGLSLYDFGDSIRFGANTAAEDERDLSKVGLDLELFEYYTKGYLSEAGEMLNETEKDCLPVSALLMTLECGMRFLTDYLDGDVYFKTSYPEHNLDRCRSQFKLAEDMEGKLDEMKLIVSKYR